MGWKDNQKKNIFNRSQLGLYKKYYALKHNIDPKMIETQFMIFKRKIWENSEYPQPRVSKFDPPTGTASQNKYSKLLDNFVNLCFVDGEYNTERKYPIAKYAASCKWCPYKDHPDNLCPKWEKKRKNKMLEG